MWCADHMTKLDLETSPKRAEKKTFYWLNYYLVIANAPQLFGDLYHVINNRE